MNERDHKKLGKELDLFTFSDTVGKGLPLFTPKGSVIRRELERLVVDEETRRGYEHVYTPDIAKLDLYKKSGHYPHYQDSMYAPIKIDDEEFMLDVVTQIFTKTPEISQCVGTSWLDFSFHVGWLYQRLKILSRMITVSFSINRTEVTITALQSHYMQNKSKDIKKAGNL